MNVCYAIADHMQRRRAKLRRHQQPARVGNDQAYWKWQFDTSRDLFRKFFDLSDRLRDASVIDIGCGLGGRTCYLARQGVRRIVGTDINHGEIDRASELADQLGDREIRERAWFRKVDEHERRPFAELFDVALLVDSLEHVHDPADMLNYAHGLLKPGGVCYFSTCGWYHHQASHVGSIVPIPFATLFFSDRQILDAVRKIVDQPYYQPTIWDSHPPSLRWIDCHSLHDRPGEYLNKYTITKFRRSMRSSAFTQWRLKVQGFSAKRHPWLAALNFLTRIPLIQEVYHSAIFGRLEKTGQGVLPAGAVAGRPMRVSA
jgi:2-polyprenyl-3-methyl-5-hydroxy-6-metoxy-1,4-benzoquinol methylase